MEYSPTFTPIVVRFGREIFHTISVHGASGLTLWGMIPLFRFQVWKLSLLQGESLFGSMILCPCIMQEHSPNLWISWDSWDIYPWAYRFKLPTSAARKRLDGTGLIVLGRDGSPQLYPSCWRTSWPARVSMFFPSLLGITELPVRWFGMILSHHSL